MQINDAKKRSDKAKKQELNLENIIKEPEVMTVLAEMEDEPNDA